MPLPFRQRIFVILVALTAVPTALAVVGWALAVRTVAPSAGARVALEEMAASARLMVDRMDTTHLSLRERAAFREHLEQLSNSVTLARRAETRSEEHTSELQSRLHLVCRLLLEKKKKKKTQSRTRPTRSGTRPESNV